MSTTLVKLKAISLDWIQLLMILGAVAGLGVSIYLMWGYTVPGATLSCGGSSGCETVKNSEYARLAGIPLPILGLLAYLAILVLIVGQNYSAVVRNGWSSYLTLATFGISLVGVLYSAYLTYLELFVIYAICRWCVASALIMLILFLFSIFNLRNSNQS